MTATYPIVINRDKEMFLFTIAESFDQRQQHIKFDVFLGGKQMASFEPDAQETCWVCLNPGKLDDDLINQLLDKIEDQYR